MRPKLVVLGLFGLTAAGEENRTRKRRKDDDEEQRGKERGKDWMR